ncbi:MAG: phosphonate metabolism protein/1,5-bisphosphokinase (PRPP-forming) PhnN [Burkholderiales bacterium]|jgi:phosphonate metabolism protein PhnN/1,5-bisphosphokinase (PRPP-forming)
MTLRELSGRLLVVVGASGAGKDSVIAAWLASIDEATRPHRARRTITRPAHDASEDHEPVDAARFESLRAARAFAFHWDAHGLRYGVRHEALAPLVAGRWVVVNGSRAHLAELRAVAPGARVVEIEAAAVMRAARLGGRGREAGDAIVARLERVVASVEPDLRVVNDGPLDAAVATLDAWWRGLAQRGVDPERADARLRPRRA